MAECLNAGIGISSGSQLPQSRIGIPTSGFSPVPLVTDYSGIAQLCSKLILYRRCGGLPNKNMMGEFACNLRILPFKKTYSRRFCFRKVRVHNPKNPKSFFSSYFRHSRIYSKAHFLLLVFFLSW